MHIRHKRALVAGGLLLVIAAGVWAAIDTAAKRASALSAANQSTRLVIPDGTISKADRQTITGMYGEVSAGADVTPPTVLSRTIATNGTTFTVGFSEAVSQAAGYADSDFTLTCSGGATTVTYSNGDGTSSHIYTISRTIQGTPGAEVCTLAHDGSANSIEDAAGNDLASFTGASVTNNSTQDTIAPTFVSARISGSMLTVTYSDPVTAGAGGTGGHAIASCSGGAVTPTYASGAGSNQPNFTLSRAPDPAETGCVLAYTQPGNGFEDSAGNDVATYSGQAITISSGADNCPSVINSPIQQPIKTPLRQPLCA